MSARRGGFGEVSLFLFFFFQAEDGIRDAVVTGVQTCALPISAKLADGTLAGSVLTMNSALKNVLQYTGCTLADALQMAAENPARKLGVFDKKGSIALGKDADL